MFNRYFCLFKRYIIQISLMWSILISSFSAYAVCERVTEIPVVECETLVDFYNGLDGPNWTDSPGNQWTLTDTPCSWTGVECINDHVQKIHRVSQQLNGALTSLAALTQLESLDVTDNKVQGTLDVTLLPISLKVLELGINELENNLEVGPLAALTNLSQLTILNLSGNRFNGELPDLSVLNLTEIDVSANALYGLSQGLPPTWLENIPEVNISYNTFEIENLIPSLREHLANQNNNLDTQTIPPTVTSIIRLSASNAQVSWVPITYSGDTGFYEVHCYDHPLDNPGPPISSQRTVDKNATSLIIQGLTADTNYFCGIRTVTEPHSIQKNTVGLTVSFGEIQAQVANNQAPILEPIPNQAITLGDRLTLTAKASDPDNDPLVFSLLPNVLVGTTINATTGVFQWIPAAGGNFPVTIMVSDFGHSSTATLTDSVIFSVDVNQAPVLQPVAKQTVKVGDTVKFTAIATDINKHQLQYNITNLPTDARFNTETGNFQWQPTVPMTTNLNVTVTELNGKPTNLMANQTVIIEVLAQPDDPTPPTETPSTGTPVNSGLVIFEPIVDLNINTIVRNTQGNILENPTIGKNASISGGILSGNITNQGLVSNTVITGTLTGGRLSGTIINQGTICGTEISIYATVIGGLFCDLTDNYGKVVNSTILSSGSIEGGEASKRVRNYGLLKDVTLEPFAQVVGGKMEGKIIGDEKGIAQIGATEIAEDSTLCNVRLSPTVLLPKNVNLCENVLFPEIPEEPILEDFGIDPQSIPQFDAQRVSEIEPAAFGYFTSKEFKSIPSEALVTIMPEQISAIRVETLEDMTPAQFAQIPLTSLSGFTAENIGGLPAEVLTTVTKEQLNALDAKSVRKSQTLAALLTNLNPELTPADAQHLLPENWAMDDIGRLTAPKGAQVGYSVILLDPEIPTQIDLPLQFNLGTGFGLAGWSEPGENLQDDLQAALSMQDLPFIITQGKEGILQIEGEGSFKDANLAFIIDVDNVIQADQEVPVGLSNTTTGKFVLTTPKRQQFPLIPTTQNPVGLFKLLAALQLTIDKKGITLATVPANTRAGGFVHHVFMFDPFISPNPPPPNHFSTGIHFQRRIRAASPEQGFIVYENNTLQDITATVPSPEIFIAEGLKFEGVENIGFNVDGTFSLVFQGENLRAVPTFEVSTREVQGDPRRFKPSLELNADNSLQYQVLYNNQMLSLKLNIVAEE